MYVYIDLVCRVCHSLEGATLFLKFVLNTSRVYVENEIALISAKFSANLVTVSQVTSCKTKWPFCLVNPVT